MAPALPRLVSQCLLRTRGSHPRKPCPASAVARFPRPAASPTAHGVAQAVLGRVAKDVVAMERASYLGDTENGCRLASQLRQAELQDRPRASRQCSQPACPNEHTPSGGTGYVRSFSTWPPPEDDLLPDCDCNSRREVAGDVQNQLRDAGYEGISLAVDVRHDRHVGGDRPVDGVQRRGLWLLLSIRPQRQIAESAERYTVAVHTYGRARLGGAHRLSTPS